MLKNQKLLCLILIAVLTIGCHQLTTIPVPQNPILVNFGSQFSLKVNQVALIESENLKIKFLNVEEDSRCPSEVQCVWPGQVKIIVNVVKNKRDFGGLHLISRVAEEDLAVKTFDGYSIRLIDVAPYPKKTEKLEISDYIVTLVVSQV